ncbi:saccharopine dehydrogenase family protein [Azospirillum halopraeferens]|uniref:saccharopine dehydrogenase family protein n=1 Tax=Azospirillum halopraeferens TaxID=34010 RepID=UPI0003F963F7|nr:saccharopine dehydrogenase NADP-binding domain-containing protein [Azospirillum halopraeferens]
MTNVLLLGAGKIGSMICHLLHATGEYTVTVADRDEAGLRHVARDEARRLVLDVADPAALADALAGHAVVISALPYYLNAAVAEAARAAGAHYFDLTEDVETTRRVRAIAEGADTAFVPQCGLAPGFVSIVAADLAKRFETLRDVHMRVGALPLYPNNALKYNLTWSTDGLINEYCNPCEAIHEGELREVLPLQELETFSLDGVEYEAFNTSGGLGTLCSTLAGRVHTLNYKTVRYPGHRDHVKFLARDLRLCERRDLFKDVLENAVPMTKQDVVLVFVSVSGQQDGRLMQESFARKIYNARIGGTPWSAIQITTAAGVCAMVDLLRDGKLPQAGFVRQEDADLADFLANRFGRHYA